MDKPNSSDKLLESLFQPDKKSESEKKPKETYGNKTFETKMKELKLMCQSQHQNMDFLWSYCFSHYQYRGGLNIQSNLSKTELGRIYSIPSIEMDRRFINNDNIVISDPRQVPPQTQQTRRRRVASKGGQQNVQPVAVNPQNVPTPRVQQNVPTPRVQQNVVLVPGPRQDVQPVAGGQPGGTQGGTAIGGYSRIKTRHKKKNRKKIKTGRKHRRISKQKNKNKQRGGKPDVKIMAERAGAGLTGLIAWPIAVALGVGIGITGITLAPGIILAPAINYGIELGKKDQLKHKAWSELKSIVKSQSKNTAEITGLFAFMTFMYNILLKLFASSATYASSSIPIGSAILIFSGVFIAPKIVDYLLRLFRKNYSLKFPDDVISEFVYRGFYVDSDYFPTKSPLHSYIYDVDHRAAILFNMDESNLTSFFNMVDLGKKLLFSPDKAFKTIVYGVLAVGGISVITALGNLLSSLRDTIMGTYESIELINKQNTNSAVKFGKGAYTISKGLLKAIYSTGYTVVDFITTLLRLYNEVDTPLSIGYNGPLKSIIDKLRPLLMKSIIENVTYVVRSLSETNLINILDKIGIENYLRLTGEYSILYEKSSKYYSSWKKKYLNQRSSDKLRGPVKQLYQTYRDELINLAVSKLIFTSTGNGITASFTTMLQFVTGLNTNEIKVVLDDPATDVETVDTKVENELRKISTITRNVGMYGEQFIVEQRQKLTDKYNSQTIKQLQKLKLELKQRLSKVNDISQLKIESVITEIQTQDTELQDDMVKYVGKYPQSSLQPYVGGRKLSGTIDSQKQSYFEKLELFVSQGNCNADPYSYYSSYYEGYVYSNISGSPDTNRERRERFYQTTSKQKFILSRSLYQYTENPRFQRNVLELLVGGVQRGGGGAPEPQPEVHRAIAGLPPPPSTKQPGKLRPRPRSQNPHILTQTQAYLTRSGSSSATTAIAINAAMGKGRFPRPRSVSSVEALGRGKLSRPSKQNDPTPHQKRVAKKQTEQNYVQNLQQQQFPDVIESASTKYTSENLNRLLFNSERILRGKQTGGYQDDSRYFEQYGIVSSATNISKFMVHKFIWCEKSQIPLVNICYTNKINKINEFVNPVRASIQSIVPIEIDHYYIDNLCNLLFYTNLLQDQFSEYKENKKTLQEMETVLVSISTRREFSKFLSNNSCLVFENALLSKQVNGSANPFETLRTLDENPRKMDIVKSGHIEQEQRQLDRAIAILKQKHSEKLETKIKQDQEDSSQLPQKEAVARAAESKSESTSESGPLSRSEGQDNLRTPEQEESTKLSEEKDIVERVRDLTKQDNVKLEDLRKELTQTQTKDSVLSSKPGDTLQQVDSYIPSDTSKVIQITADELSLLETIEDKVIQQMKLDKELYQQNKNHLKQLVIDKQRQIDDKLAKEGKINAIKASNLQYQQDIMEKYYEEQKQRLRKRTTMIEQKRKKDQLELSRFKQSYVRKLHNHYEKLYEQLQRKYKGELQKQRVLYDELTQNDEWKHSREGDNVYLKELKDKLQSTYEVPIMVKTKRKSKKVRTKKKLKQTKPGVDAVRTLVKLSTSR